MCSAVEHCRACPTKMGSRAYCLVVKSLLKQVALTISWWEVQQDLVGHLSLSIRAELRKLSSCWNRRGTGSAHRSVAPSPLQPALPCSPTDPAQPVCAHSGCLWGALTGHHFAGKSVPGWWAGLAP